MPKVSDAHVEARRQQILEAASACFARQGFHQTSVQDICKEAGLSAGAVYRYFPGKERQEFDLGLSQFFGRLECHCVFPIRSLVRFVYRRSYLMGKGSVLLVPFLIGRLGILSLPRNALETVCEVGRQASTNGANGVT